MNLIPVRQYLKHAKTTALATQSHSLHVPLAWCAALWFKGRIVHHQGIESTTRLAPPAFVSSQVYDTDFKQAAINANPQF